MTTLIVIELIAGVILAMIYAGTELTRELARRPYSAISRLDEDESPRADYSLSL